MKGIRARSASSGGGNFTGIGDAPSMTLFTGPNQLGTHPFINFSGDGIQLTAVGAVSTKARIILEGDQANEIFHAYFTPVDLINESVSGTVEFNDVGFYISQINSPLSPVRIGVKGSSYHNVTEIGNQDPGGSESDAYAHNLYAMSLAFPGSSYDFEAAGNYVTGSEVRVFFAGMEILFSGSLVAVGTQDWSLKGTLIGSGLNQQKAIVTFQTSSGISVTKYTALAQSAGVPQQLKLTLAGTAPSDCVAQFYKEFFSPPAVPSA